MGKKIKAIIFDMDGVLIDAKDWHYEALNNALSLFGQEISRYDHLITFDGLPTKKKLEMLSLERNLPTSLHSFINDLKQQNTEELVHLKCKPYFPHQFALSKLKQSGYKMSVCSNSVKKSIELMLTKAKLLHYFDFFLSNQDVKNGKPNPEIYNTAIKMFGFDPTECLVIEDNENGIKAALASGANLLRVNSVSDVNYDNIKTKIRALEEESD